jgi:hypothetical protein
MTSPSPHGKVHEKENDGGVAPEVSSTNAEDPTISPESGVTSTVSKSNSVDGNNGKDASIDSTFASNEEEQEKENSLSPAVDNTEVADAIASTSLEPTTSIVLMMTHFPVVSEATKIEPLFIAAIKDRDKDQVKKRAREREEEVQKAKRAKVEALLEVDQLKEQLQESNSLVK